MLITKAEAARIIGVTNQAVARAIADGRIDVVEEGGKEWLERDGLEDRWQANSRKRIPNIRRHPDLRKPRPQRMTTEPSQLPDYNESRARTEWLKAELMELERAEKEGELVKAAEVAKKWGEVVAIARTKVMGIPSKAKQRIPEIPADAFVALEDIVREALEDLADG
jgi:phage terminase Nu1 subunit (DNA packaging protein)